MAHNNDICATKTKTMIKALQTQIISRHLQTLTAKVRYYQNLHDPELKHNTGLSALERAEIASKELNDFKDSLKYLSFDSLDIKKYEKANYLRAYAIECYDMAKDFTENIYIVMRRLRECVEVRKEIIKLYPNLETYSNRAICTRVAITL